MASRDDGASSAPHNVPKSAAAAAAARHSRHYSPPLPLSLTPPLKPPRDNSFHYCEAGRSLLERWPCEWAKIIRAATRWQPPACRWHPQWHQRAAPPPPDSAASIVPGRTCPAACRGTSLACLSVRCRIGDRLLGQPGAPLRRGMTIRRRSQQLLPPPHQARLPVRTRRTDASRTTASRAPLEKRRRCWPAQHGKLCHVMALRVFSRWDKAHRRMSVQ